MNGAMSFGRLTTLNLELDGKCTFFVLNRFLFLLLVLMLLFMFRSFGTYARALALQPVAPLHARKILACMLLGLQPSIITAILLRPV